MSQKISLIIIIEVKPGRRMEQIQAFNDIRDQVITEEGCLKYELLAVENDVNRFVLIEEWASKEALSAHDITSHMISYDAKSPLYRAKPAQVLELTCI